MEVWATTTTMNLKHKLMLLSNADFKFHGYRVTQMRDDKDSAHSHGVAIDVAPPLTLPHTPEAEAAWSAAANRLIGFDPNE